MSSPGNVPKLRRGSSSQKKHATSVFGPNHNLECEKEIERFKDATNAQRTVNCWWCEAGTEPKLDNWERNILLQHAVAAQKGITLTLSCFKPAGFSEPVVSDVKSLLSALDKALAGEEPATKKIVVKACKVLYIGLMADVEAFFGKETTYNIISFIDKYGLSQVTTKLYELISKAGGL
jgi:hypothetical protein